MKDAFYGSAYFMIILLCISYRRRGSAMSSWPKVFPSEISAAQKLPPRWTPPRSPAGRAAKIDAPTGSLSRFGEWPKLFSAAPGACGPKREWTSTVEVDCWSTKR